MPLGRGHACLRAGACLSSLACAGALTAHAREGKIRALYVTSVFPKDTMPIDVIVEHQLRTLGGPNVELRAVVFDNQPPWLNTSDAELRAASEMQQQGLKNLQQGEVPEKLLGVLQEGVIVKTMDYAETEDPAFLRPLFDVKSTDGVEKSLRQIFGTGNLDTRGAQKQQKGQILSNFFAMTHFMKECMRPEHDDMDFCLYFDPDMLMYRNHTGILELATATFESNPELAIVAPPFGCHKEKWHRKNQTTGECPSRPFGVSSRHVIARRRRLLAKLPISLASLPNFGKSYWEAEISYALGPAARGQMLCGDEFFIAHPPSRFSPLYQPHASDDPVYPLIPLGKLLQMLVPESDPCSSPGFCSPQRAAILGTRELVRRFEAGKMRANKWTLMNKGCSCCADMMPNASRIGAGMAFYEPRGDAESERFDTEVNDFEWVVKCMQ